MHVRFVLRLQLAVALFQRSELADLGLGLHDARENRFRLLLGGIELFGDAGKFSG